MTRWQPKMQPFNIVESDARPRVLNYEYPISKSAPSFETQLRRRPSSAKTAMDSDLVFIFRRRNGAVHRI